LFMLDVNRKRWDVLMMEFGCTIRFVSVGCRL
jgi:hypothetical protein